MNTDETRKVVANMVIRDDEYRKTLRLISKKGVVYTTLLQLEMKIGYLRARKIMEKLEADGFIKPPIGNKQGEVITKKIIASGILNNK